MKREQKSILAILLSLMLLLGLTACGGASGGSDMAYTMTAASTESASGASAAMNGYAMEDAEYWADIPMDVPEPESRSTQFDLPDGVKMIYRANLELETQEFDQAQADITALTQRLGGYFESQSSYNYNANYRSADYTVRVPAEHFEEFLYQAGELFSVRSRTLSADDVSEYYYDMESRLETAKIKLERLQNLLAQAENMEDIITIESAISDTEYQIENLSGELRHYDSLIGYSTIYVSLQETYQPTEQQSAPLTFGDRMGRAFQNGLRSFRYFLEDLALWLAEAWLPLLAVLAIAVLVARLVRRRKNGGKLLRRRNKNTPTNTTEENNQS